MDNDEVLELRRFAYENYGVCTSCNHRFSQGETTHLDSMD